MLCLTHRHCRPCRVSLFWGARGHGHVRSTFASTSSGSAFSIRSSGCTQVTQLSVLKNHVSPAWVPQWTVPHCQLLRPWHRTYFRRLRHTTSPHDLWRCAHVYVTSSYPSRSI